MKFCACQAATAVRACLLQSSQPCLWHALKHLVHCPTQCLLCITQCKTLAACMHSCCDCCPAICLMHPFLAWCDCFFCDVLAGGGVMIGLQEKKRKETKRKEKKRKAKKRKKKKSTEKNRNEKKRKEQKRETNRKPLMFWCCS